MPLSSMLRIYFLQQWYGLSDPGAEEALYDMHSMRDFAGLDLGRDAIPDGTTILSFRHLLERHEFELFPILDHPAGVFSGVIAQGANVPPEQFISDIGGLFPIALWGRTVL